MPPEVLLLPAVRSECREDEAGGFAASPPVRAALERVAAFARTRWNALSAAIFVAAVAAVALIAATVSDLDWDLLAYTAVVFEDTIDTPEALHAATYAAMEHAATQQQWWQLLNAYPFRAHMYANPDDFVSVLGMYRLKLGYIWLLEEFGAETNPVLAAKLVNALAVVVIGAAVFAFFASQGAMGALGPMAFVLLACNWLGMGIAPQPDAMAGALALSAVLLVAARRPLFAVPFLFAAMMVRTDNIILIFALLLAALAYGSMRWVMALTFAVALAYVTVGLDDAGHPGWWPHVYFSVIGIQDTMADFNPPFDLMLYAKTLVEHAAMIFRHNNWGALLILALFGWAVLAARSIPLGTGGRIAVLACLLAAGGKFVVFPLSLDRIYFAQAMGAAAVILAASRLTLSAPPRT